MPQIDPVYFLTPVATIGLTVGLVLWWRRRRRLTGQAMLVSLVAYAAAIVAKYAVQIPTFNAFTAATGGSMIGLGVYYGSQTAAFEVGGAYIAARYAVSRGRLKAEDAEGFGLGLAFWENGVLISMPLLLNYIIYYAAFASPGSGIAQTLYPILSKDAPGLFLPPAGALPLVAYAVLERASSVMAHLAWGTLAMVAAVRRRWIYLAVAVPIGFIDFLVPFSASLGLGVFESIVFLVAAVGLTVALKASDTAQTRGASPVPDAAASNT